MTIIKFFVGREISYVFVPRKLEARYELKIILRDKSHISKRRLSLPDLLRIKYY